MADPKPFPLYTDGAGIFFTTDGVNFNELSSGGGGAVTTDASLTGDGSALTPLAISATNKAILASVDSSWAQQEAIAIAAAIPGITQFKPIHVGNTTPAGAAAAPTATDPALEGGGIFANDAANNTFFYQSVFQAPVSGKWSISFLGKLLGSGAAGHDSYFGIINGASTHGYVFGWANAASSSKFSYSQFGAGAPIVSPSSLNGDANIHVFRIMFDGTTVSVVVDGSVVYTNAVLTGMSDEPMYPCMASLTVKQAKLVDCLVGFVLA